MFINRIIFCFIVAGSRVAVGARVLLPAGGARAAVPVHAHVPGGQRARRAARLARRAAPALRAAAGEAPVQGMLCYLNG